MADRAAQRVVSLPDFSLPAAAYQRRHQRFFRNPSILFWWLFLKGNVSGSLAAPSLSSPILNTLTFPAAVLFYGSLTFLMPRLIRGPLLAHLRMLALPPALLGPYLLCPLLLPPPSPTPGHSADGASAIHTRSGRLSTAPRTSCPQRP